MDRFIDLGINTLFRCDRCNAQAFAGAAKDDLMLLFCGHHYKQHMLLLMATGWEVHDHTDRINVQPSLSANAL